jgi:hypothetical protein
MAGFRRDINDICATLGRRIERLSVFACRDILFSVTNSGSYTSHFVPWKGIVFVYIV